ncbi:MAG: hypothetical protein ACUVQR_12970 [Thermogutta sp.]
MTSQPDLPKNGDLLESIRVDRDDPQDPFVRRLRMILEGDPGLAKRYEEIRRRDVETANLLKFGAENPGLEERILAQFTFLQQHRKRSAETAPAAEENTQGEKGLIASSTAEVVGFSASGELPGKVRRRYWLRWVVGTITAGAATGIGLWVWQAKKVNSQLSASDFGIAVTELFETTLNGFGAGRDLAKERPPHGYRFSRDVRLFPGTVITWRELVVHDRPVVAFDINHPGGEKGSLFATRGLISGLPAIPPRQPCLRTSRSSAGWWQDNDLAYVLVVLGSPRVYQRFLAPLGPLT